MPIDPYYLGSDVWQRKIPKTIGTPYELAYWARDEFPKHRARSFCEGYVESNMEPTYLEKDDGTFHTDDKGQRIILHLGLGDLNGNEQKLLVKKMLADLKTAGCVTDDGFYDWIPGIMDVFETIDWSKVYGDDESEEDVTPPVTDNQPVTFQTKVQKRGHSTAIYIPKKMEREAEISAGDIVEISLKPVSH